MKQRIVSSDAPSLPRLTDETRARLAELAERPVSDIDFSDIPEITEEQWKSAICGRFYRPVKQQITARIDADVLDWLKSGTPSSHR